MGEQDHTREQLLEEIQALRRRLADRDAARQQAEDRLRASEEQHRLIADLTADYSYTCRVGPDGAIELESVTEGFARVTGYTLADVNARGGWACLIHPEDHPVVATAARRILAAERDVYEVRVITQARDTRWIRCSTQPVWDERQGRVVRLVGAVQDVTERKQAELQARAAAGRLRELSHRLMAAQEAERRHVARELHDEVGQALTGLGLTLDRAAAAPPAEARRQLAEARRQVRELVGTVRELSLRLRPSMLEDLGLLPALLWLFERYTAQTGVRVDFGHAGLGALVPPAVATAAYRITQEALTNVARHAAVTAAVVEVWVEEGNLLLRVRDQGAGFQVPDARAPPATGGITGMEERAKLLGGRLEIESRPGRGTCLTAAIPLTETSSAS